jgi:hypothetical protein
MCQSYINFYKPILTISYMENSREYFKRMIDYWENGRRITQEDKNRFLEEMPRVISDECCRSRIRATIEQIYQMDNAGKEFAKARDKLQKANQSLCELVSEIKEAAAELNSQWNLSA